MVVWHSLPKGGHWGVFHTPSSRPAPPKASTGFSAPPAATGPARRCAVATATPAPGHRPPQEMHALPGCRRGLVQPVVQPRRALCTSRTRHKAARPRLKPSRGFRGQDLREDVLLLVLNPEPFHQPEAQARNTTYALASASGWCDAVNNRRLADGLARRCRCGHGTHYPVTGQKAAGLPCQRAPRARLQFPNPLTA